MVPLSAARMAVALSWARAVRAVCLLIASQVRNARRAPVNTGEPELWGLYSAERRVQEIQAKLHRWASDDPHRRFDDLYNPATIASLPAIGAPAGVCMAYRPVSRRAGSQAWLRGW